MGRSRLRGTGKSGGGSGGGGGGALGGKSVSWSAAQDLTTSFAPVTGASVDFTAVAGHTYFVVGKTHPYSSQAGDFLKLAAYIDGASVIASQFTSQFAGLIAPLDVVGPLTGLSAGTHTLTLEACIGVGATGTGHLYADAQVIGSLTVIDLG